jgi:hypothetical protein
MGAQLIYEAVSPYPDSQVGDLDYVQTADELFFAHINYAPRKLVRYDHTDWRFSTITFGPVIDPPATIGASATTPNTTGYIATNYHYKASAVKDTQPVQESRASAIATVENDLSLAGNYNTITLPALPDGVDRYIIYKEQGGGYGYIGSTEGTTFKDGPPPYIPVLSETPPIGENPFGADGSGDNPSTVRLHQQRLWYARTRNIVNGVWASRIGDYENMDRSRPVRADDSILFAVAADKVNAINAMASLDDLILLTSDSIVAVQGGEGGVLTPGDINPKRQSSRGASRLRPIPVDSVLFFVPNSGYSLRSLGFTFEIEGYKSDNVSIFSPHFFDGYAIVSMAYQAEPFACIWLVRDDGAMLCFTWEPEQQVWGFTLCETEGSFEKVAVITEDGYDRLYALIRRTIGGVERVFWERMALPHRDDIATSCHLDCAVTQVYDPPQGHVDGLWHLEGTEVSIVFDGNVVHNRMVENGRAYLPDGYTATIISAGLPFVGELETLPAALMTQAGSAHTNRQLIDEIVVRALDTRGIAIGAGGTTLQQVEPMEGEIVSELADIEARDYRVPAEGDWKDTSTIVIQQNEPLPAHIIGIFASRKVGEE